MGRRTLLLIASMLIAALATGLVWFYIASADTRADGRQALTPTLVSAGLIPANTSLSQLASMVTVQDYRQADRPPGAYNSMKELLKDLGLSDTKSSKLVVRNDIEQGFPIIKRQFTQSAGNGSVKVGRMAVTISLGEANRVAPLLDVGNSVAVYLISPMVNGKGSSVHLVLPSITIEAIDNRTLTQSQFQDQDQNHSLPPKGGGLITFDVDGKEATTLIAALKSGELYFTLLSPDTKASSSDNTDTQAILAKAVQ